MTGPLVLLYHDVLQSANEISGFSGKDAGSYKISSHLFGQHVQAVAASQYPAIFSFDDGGISCFTTIAPLLEQYQFTGLFFIPTAFIGKPGFMTETQIKELYQQGHIIGSHGHFHRPLSHMSYKNVLKEWQQSIDILKKITGEHTTDASLPGGWYSEAVAKAAAEAGIRTLYTSEPTADSFEIHNCKVQGRFNIDSSSHIPAILSDNNLQKQLHDQWDKKEIVKKVFGGWYLKIRGLIK